MLNQIDLELDCIKNYLQKQVTFCVGQKTVRRGKLLLYNVSDYYIKFTIKTNKDIQKTYEVPFPFQVYDNINYLILSYKIDDLCAGNSNRVNFINDHFTDITNKLYDKRLIISIIDP
jgi:hypothetical protein